MPGTTGHLSNDIQAVLKKALLDCKKTLRSSGVDGVRRALVQGTTPSESGISDTLFYIVPELVDESELLTQIAPVVSAHGVNAYGAEIEIYQAGDVDEPDDYESRRQESRYYGDAGNGCDEGEDDDVDFEEVDTEEFKIKSLTTSDGVPVEDLVDVSFNGDEIIPKDFRDDLDEPYEKDFEGIWGDGRLRLWYRCSALVFSFKNLSDTENVEDLTVE